MPRRTRQTTERFWGDVLSPSTTISSCGNEILGSGSVLGCEAWNSQDWHVGAGFILCCPEALVAGRVYQPLSQFAAACIGRDSTKVSDVAGVQRGLQREEICIRICRRPDRSSRRGYSVLRAGLLAYSS